MGKVRQSNIELLRIVSMFLVLVVHADFAALGIPSSNDLISAPTESLTRLFVESMSIVCVNVFILISGWFGIRHNIKGFCNFIFQCLFFLIGIYTVGLAFGTAKLSLPGILGCFALLPNNWFIKAYIGLYILSPIINIYIECAEERQYRHLLIAFFTFQTIYGCSGAAVFFEGGYSTISFMGLYLLARYVNIYRHRIFDLPKKWYIGGYFALSLILAIFASLCIRMDISQIHIWKLYSYINPMVIIASLCLILYFNKLEFTNRFVNRIAASAFAVFLLHTNPNMYQQYFISQVKLIYDNWGGVRMFTVNMSLFDWRVYCCGPDRPS